MHDETDFHDIADSPSASYWPDPIDEIEGPEVKDPPSKLAVRLAKELDGVTDENERAEILHAATKDLRPISAYSSALRGLLVRILEARDSKLEVKVICASVSIPVLSEETLAEMGVRSGLCRAAVSKRLREAQDDFGISASGYSKKASSCETYRRTNVRRKAKVNLTEKSQ
jgi:hypothetical protein